MSIDKLDKESQEALDKNRSLAAPDEDTKAYRTLYEVLDNLPTEDYLPSTFADKVVSRLKPKSIKGDTQAFWWYGSMILFLMLSGLVILALVMVSLKMDILSFAGKYGPIMLFATVVVLVVQWMDGRLVRV